MGDPDPPDDSSRHPEWVIPIPPTTAPGTPDDSFDVEELDEEDEDED
jgi:hypothetical protein